MTDPEIAAMGAVADALAELDDGSRGRVLRWAADRFEVVLTAGSAVKGTTNSNGEHDEDGDDAAERDVVDRASYEHFADLFDAASPKSNDEKTLVAAYWVQVHDGNDQWSSYLLTNELKNLGHAPPNITQALNASINKQPKRVIQLKKSGNSKQARKTYKVTTEGIKYVERLLDAGGD